MTSQGPERNSRNKPKRAPMAGGFLLMVGILAGTAIGLMKGQPSAGFLLGLSLGAVLAVAIWFFDRRD